MAASDSIVVLPVTQRHLRSRLRAESEEWAACTWVGAANKTWVLGGRGQREAEVMCLAEQVPRDHSWVEVKRGPATSGCFQRSQEADEA